MTRATSKHQTGSALMIVILMLSSVMAISLTVSLLVFQGIRASRIQEWSTIAYFAAEAGAERLIYETWKTGNIDIFACSNGQYIDLDNPSVPCADSTAEHNPFSNNAIYSILYHNAGDVSLEITGEYFGTKRTVKVTY